MRSIRSRLFGGLSVVLGLLLIGQWLWLTLTIDRFIEHQVLAQLHDETDSLLASLEMDPDGQLRLDSRHLSSGYQRIFSGHYYAIQAAETVILSRSLWDFDLALQPIEQGQQRVVHVAGPQDQPLLMVTSGYHKQGVALTLHLAQDIGWMLAEKRSLEYRFTLLSAIGVILLLLIQAGLVARALRPLQRARSQLKQLDEGKREHIDEQAPEEIRPLLHELNRLMGGMVLKTRRSRQALGNLAHRLKTQLAVLNQIADSDLLDSNPPARDAIFEQTSAIGQIIDRELRRARLSGFAMPGKGVDIESLIVQLAETLTLIYRDRPLVIDRHITGDVRLAADREDMLELLGNLLDNACKWSRQRVRIQVGMVNGGVEFAIEDDGPGCETAVMSTLIKRGFRADESRPGSGLGLAIVQDIVDSYGGTVSFARSKTLGGLQVVVHLPAASRSQD